MGVVERFFYVFELRLLGEKLTNPSAIHSDEEETFICEFVMGEERTSSFQPHVQEDCGAGQPQFWEVRDDGCVAFSQLIPFAVGYADLYVVGVEGEVGRA